MARTSHISKQALIVFLAFVLHFTAFTNAYAATSSNAIGGWSIVNTIQQGATTLFNLSKTAVINGANVAKTSTAKITPTAAQVAKNIAKVGAVGAVALAIDLLLDGADYVMDPANNRVIYYDNSDPNDPTLKNYYYYREGNNIYPATTEQGVCDLLTKNKGTSFYLASGSLCRQTSNPSTYFSIAMSSNPAYDPTAEREEKYLPYTTVGQQVIDDANSGRTDVAPPYIGGIAQDLVNNGIGVGAGGSTVGGQSASDSAAAQQSVKDQAEANAKTETQDTSSNSQAKPNDAGGYDITLEFPAFCGWAPLVCQAAQIVISFPSLVTGWWNTVSDWLSNTQEWWNTGKNAITSAWQQVKDWVQEATDYFRDEPELDDDTELEIPDITESPDTTISFGGYCPAPLSTPVSFAGISTSIDIEFTWLCQVADFIKPIVIALSSFTAALIVAGIRIEDD